MTTKTQKKTAAAKPAVKKSKAETIQSLQVTDTPVAAEETTYVAPTKDAQVQRELSIVIDKISAVIPSTETVIKTLKNGDIRKGNEHHEEVMSAVAFTDWLVGPDGDDALQVMEVESAVISISSDDGEVNFQLRATDSESLRTALCFVKADDYSSRVQGDLGDYLSGVRAKLANVYDCLGGIKLIAGGIQVVYAETETTNELKLRILIRNNVIRMVRTEAKKKPKVTDISLFDLVATLREANADKAKIKVMSNVESAFLFGEERDHCIVVEVDGQQLGLTTPGQLVTLVRKQVRVYFESQLLDSLQQLGEFRAAITEQLTSVKDELGGWVKDLEEMLPELVEIEAEAETEVEVEPLDDVADAVDDADKVDAVADVVDKEAVEA